MTAPTELDIDPDVPDVPEIPGADDEHTAPEPPVVPPAATVVVKSGVVARALNSLKAIIAFIGSALAGVVTFLPEGDYKRYTVIGIAVLTTAGTYLAKNQPLIEELGDDALDAYTDVLTVVRSRGKHEAKTPADQLSIGPDSIA